MRNPRRPGYLEADRPAASMTSAPAAWPTRTTCHDEYRREPAPPMKSAAPYARAEENARRIPGFITPNIRLMRSSLKVHFGDL